ncbi:hypothetical protein Q3O60_04790 [Alkalimonas collagenimarina]|uniref:Uncharacterized protein n=1 Tax=Alkalimonas collagenimarina TaxID=400390 RepID=A0ABT9GWR4_9GAMM|nr:hypothetical protein [Alkalimonas collagenimarina]MDP4535507.1 hypothetical protein [Alkalimonas collagenimarina]
MFTFSDYKKLEPDIRAIATRYWTEVVKQRLGVTTPNQILAKHLGEEITSIPGWSNNSSRFWNRMLQGKALLRENNADKTDGLLPGTKAIFTHSLWQLLGSNSFEQVFINKVLLSLSPEIIGCLFKTNSDGSMHRKTTLSTKTVQFLCSLNSLDALTCLLALSLAARNEGQLSIQLRYERGALSVFLRMVTLTELKIVAVPLYDLMSYAFNQNDNDAKRVSALHKSLPIPTRILPSQDSNIARALSSYKIILTLAKEKGLICDNFQEQLILLNQINHANIADILMEIVAVERQRGAECIRNIALSNALTEIEKHRRKTLV